MPYLYRIDVELQLVLSSLHGETSWMELAALLAEIAADPLFDRSMREFCDASGATMTMHYGEVQRAALADPYGPNAVRAVLVDSEENYGVARQYDTVLSTEHAAPLPCRTIKEASEHLGVSPEVLIAPRPTAGAD